MGALFRILKKQQKTWQTIVCLLVGIFCGFSLHFRQNPFEVSESPGVNIQKDNEGNEPHIANISVSSGRLAEPTNDLAANPIAPFSAVKVRLSTDANRTLRQLDLWTNDDNCTQFNVSLLEHKSIQPRALVSFPGSGNSWIRMLLMGVTGIYVDSVYGGNDALFRSKCWLLK